jgi:hypothetical protein
MSLVISGGQTALDVHLNGTIGKFQVSTTNGQTKGVEVRYLLTHVTLSKLQNASQSKLLNMLAPVREVFDLNQLDFDEIMQRDIDDARVSLELIPYILDTSTSGLIKLFPPIVTVALPLKPNSRVPDTHYRTIKSKREPYLGHEGVSIERLTAGTLGYEHFQFEQLYRGEELLSEGSKLSLSSNNTTLAIVDGQHRAMALLALYRNLKGDWSDAKRAPYEEYYKVWHEKEINKFNLDELQLPVLICTFPQIDESIDKDIDVVRAARRVFLTLNKTAKKVSDSRNKLLNDQDIVAECLRATLSNIKNLGRGDDTGMRIWNVELDQEGDRQKIVSDVAFTGVSHLYHMNYHLLMTNAPVRDISSRNTKGAPKTRLDEAYDRLGLKNVLTQEQRTVNTRLNYSDDVAEHFKNKWLELYLPIIEKIYGKFHPFAAFAKATILLNQNLISQNSTKIEKMLFDGQATARTFDAFNEGLERRYADKEKNWFTPEIKATLERVQGTLTGRKASVEEMRNNRALGFLDNLSSDAKRTVMVNGVPHVVLRTAIDWLYENVFSTVAFQTALICTYAEAVQECLGGIQNSTEELLNEYIETVNKLFRPKSIKDLQSLLHTFQGEFKTDNGISLTAGGATFKNVVLPGEMQPAEWPKYRYLLLELWKPTQDSVSVFVDADRKKARTAIAASLYKRRVADFCNEQRRDEANLTAQEKQELLNKCKAHVEAFITPVYGKKVTLPDADYTAATLTVALEADEA